MDKNYNVDDLLSEIKRRKSERRGEPPAETPAAPPRRRESPSDGIRPAPEAFARPEAAPETSRDQPFPRQERRTASAPGPERRPTPAPAPPPQAPSQEETRVLHPSDYTGAIDTPNPAPSAPRGNPLEFDGHVRPLTDRAKIRSRYDKIAQQRKRPKLDFQVPGEAPGEPGAADFSSTQEHTFTSTSAGRRLGMTSGTGRELRLEDIKKLDFSALQDEIYYDDDDDLADAIPEGAVVDFSEYNSAADRRDVAHDIANTKLWLFLRTAFTAILTFLLFYLVLHGRYGNLPIPPAFFPEGDTMRMYMIGNTVLAVLVALVNSASVGGGLASLFRMRANSDTLAAFAVLAAIAQGVVGISKPELVDPEGLSLYFPIAALAMLFNCIGKMSMIGRIQQNFRVLSSSGRKYAVEAIESERLCHDLYKDDTRYRPTIAYRLRAGFFTDFLAHSFSDKFDVGVNRSVAPVCLIGALVVTISTYFLTQSMYASISALAAILCICATLSSTFIENIPLGKLTRKMAPRGGVVSGNKAVEDFCDTNAVILTDRDLFPAGHVSLHGIKAFSRSRIDEAILDAASVICAIDGALTPLFLDMIGGNKRLLKKVDNIVYESGMGVSAWVDQRRVLIGNRMLMRNHGIELPHDKYERGEAPHAVGEPIYLSNSGEVSARFLVDYAVDEELAVELDGMAAHGRSLIVYSSDANLTPHKIWEVYGYPEELVSTFPSEYHEEFRGLIKPRDTAPAEIVTDGKAATFVASILSCVNARASILSATVTQLVQIVLGYAIVALMAFMNYIGMLDIVRLAVYQLFWFAVIFVIQQVRKP